MDGPLLWTFDWKESLKTHKIFKALFSKIQILVTQFFKMKLPIILYLNDKEFTYASICVNSPYTHL